MSRPFSNFSSTYKRTYRKNTADKLHYFCILRAVFPESERLFRVTLKELRKEYDTQDISVIRSLDGMLLDGMPNGRVWP